MELLSFDPNGEFIEAWMTILDFEMKLLDLMSFVLLKEAKIAHKPHNHIIYNSVNSDWLACSTHDMLIIINTKTSSLI